MNEVGINAGGIAPIKPELNRIRALRSKAQIPGEFAHLHQIILGWHRVSIPVQRCNNTKKQQELRFFHFKKEEELK